jgi:hypothetical protein
VRYRAEKERLLFWNPHGMVFEACITHLQLRHDSPDFIFMQRNEGDRLSGGTVDGAAPKNVGSREKARAELSFLVNFGSIDDPRVFKIMWLHACIWASRWARCASVCMMNDYTRKTRSLCNLLAMTFPPWAFLWPAHLQNMSIS